MLPIKSRFEFCFDFAIQILRFDMS
jgi:hypothetical protein